MTTLTEKENKAFITITLEALDGMCGSEPAELHNDNFSWHNHKTIMKAGFSEPQAKGLLGSLEEKGVIVYSDDGEYPYCITEEGIDLADKLYGAAIFNLKGTV